MHKNNSFDADVSNQIKGLAVFLLLWFHLFYMDWVYNSPTIHIKPWILSLEKLQLFSKPMNICVYIFVFLSAYSLAYKLKKNRGSSRPYLTLRFVRLISNYQLVYLLSLIICSFSTQRNPILVYGGLNSIKSYTHLIIDFFGVSHLFNTPPLNPTWWYITVAITIIGITPVFYHVYKRYGISSLILSIILPYSLGIYPHKYAFMRFLFTVAFAVFCEDKNLFQRLKQYSSERMNIFQRILLMLFVLSLMVFFFFSHLQYYYITPITNTLWTFLICYSVYAYPIPGVKKILSWIGKHSMNIFMIHTFIFMYFGTALIYAPRSPLLILLALLATSLSVSLLIDIISKLIKIDKLQITITGKVCSDSNNYE